MKRYAILASCAALALAACNKPATDATVASDTSVTTTTSTDTVASTDAASSAAAPAMTGAPVASAPAAPDFVAKAAASDMFEIAAAKVAEKRSKNADVKAFAKMMMMDHMKSTAMIKKAVADSGKDIKPPMMLPDDKKAMLEALNSASDTDFDNTYVGQQVQAHTDALALMTSYSTSGDTPQLKDAAGKIVPVVQMHLDRIMAIQSSLK